jgi:hypothetical protein
MRFYAIVHQFEFQFLNINKIKQFNEGMFGYAQRILLIWIAFATLKFRDILHISILLINCLEVFCSP